MAGSKDYLGALRILEVLLSNELLAENDEFQEAYRKTVLPYIANWNYSLDQYSTTEDANEKTLSLKGVDEDLVVMVVTQLLQALNLQNKFEGSINLLRRMSKRSGSSGRSWLHKILTNREDGLPPNIEIYIAARASNQLENVADMYRHAIDGLPSGSPPATSMVLHIRLAEVLIRMPRSTLR